MTTSTPPAESDPFFQLLTDALRAGPGSPQWGEAVAKLRDGGVEGADEYRLIIRAREDIELGREFRKVSAGPGFTRKVLEAVEQEGGRKRSGIPTATLVAILAGVVILGVVIAAIVIMSRGGGSDANEIAVRKLEATSFPVAVQSSTFNAGKLQAWRKFGELPLDTDGGLKAGAAPAAATGPTTATSAPATAVGGAVVAHPPIDAGTPVSIEAEVELLSSATGQALTQLFVSDSPDFSPVSATTPREVVWTYRDGRQSVDVANGATTKESVESAKAVKVTLRLDDEVVIVEADGRRLFAGPHGLTPNTPRYIGVRFIRAAGETGASATVRSINISRAAGGQ